MYFPYFFNEVLIFPLPLKSHNSKLINNEKKKIEYGATVLSVKN